MTDPIADLLIRIKNAYLAGHGQVKVPASKTKQAVVDILAKQGYVEKVAVGGEGKDRCLEINLRYVKGAPIITEMKRVSKPGRRVYKGVDELPKILNGEGLAIISTSKGLMSAQEAKKQGMGGEVLAIIW